MEEHVNDRTPADDNTMSRRQLLTTAVAGGAVVVAALGGGTVGNLVARSQSQVELAQTRAQYELEVTKLRALVALYDQLEKVGIDAVIATGMKIVGGALGTVQAGVHAIQAGITATEDGLTAFSGMLDSLHQEADRASQALDDLMSKFQGAEAPVVAVLGTARPLGESIGSFFAAIFEKIPFGIGDNFKKAADALVALVQSIPDAVGSVTGQLLQPLRNTLFPVGGPSAVQSLLVEPITSKLLEPLKSFLGNIDQALTAWDKDFRAPVQAALDERARLRAQIVTYRQQNNV